MGAFSGFIFFNVRLYTINEWSHTRSSRLDCYIKMHGEENHVNK